MYREKSLHFQNDEFAMSNDLTVCLWMDYRTYYGELPLRKLLGDFVIFNDDLYDEFDKFK